MSGWFAEPVEPLRHIIHGNFKFPMVSRDED